MSWTKFMLRMMIHMVNVWNRVEMSRFVSFNITIRKMMTDAIYARKIVSQIWLDLLLLQLTNEVTMFLHSSTKIYL